MLSIKKKYITLKLKYKYKLKNTNAKHGDMTNKPYSSFIGKNYVRFINTSVYYSIIPFKLGSKQVYKKGDSYSVLSSRTYRSLNTDYYLTIQYLNKHTYNIQAII